MLMAAPVMTSCSNDLDEAAPVEEVKENVVTLTIKMPVQAETRVGIDDGTLKLTGWELGDIVKVYNVGYDGGVTIDGPIPFTCTDPTSGTFSGTLPDGKSLSDYNFAAYGHDIEVAGAYAGFFDNMISENLKDVILLAGPISGGNCTMTIHNNILKVTNNGSAVEVAWANDERDVANLICLLDDYNDWDPMRGREWDSFNQCSFTIPAGVSYVMTAPLEGTWGLVDSKKNWVVPSKYFEDPVVGKLFKVTIN